MPWHPEVPLQEYQHYELTNYQRFARGVGIQDFLVLIFPNKNKKIKIQKGSNQKQFNDERHKKKYLNKKKTRNYI